MKVGFTGTREGMTLAQKHAVETLLRDLHRPGAEFHHGDCVGSDEEAAAIADELGFIIHSHPPTNRSMRAFARADLEYQPLDYLVRNRAIVDVSDVMVAAVAGPEQLRSGTWSTVRYARSNARSLAVVTPDGTVVR